MANTQLHHLFSAAIFIAVTPSLIRADYSMNIELSSDRVREGGNVTVTCDVSSQQTSTALSVVWVKRTVDGAEIDIGTEGNITDKFLKTLRYNIRKQQMPDSKYRFTLIINDLKSGDSGEIGCSIPSHRIHIFKPFTVLVPIKSVRLRSRAVDKSHAEAYYDNQNVSFSDGVVRQFYCDVTGSFPQPEVSILIGERDLTSQFNKTNALIYEGPASLKGVQAMHYESELSNSNLHIGFEFGGKTMRCVANVPHSTFPPVSSSIYISFLSYRPKFVNCTNTVIRASPFQKNVLFECDIQAVPAVSSVRIKYGRRTLRAGTRDGHYYTRIVDQTAKSETMKRVVFTIDKIYPQHFRNYTLVATNSEGETHLDLEIVRDPQTAALISEASGLLHSVTALVALISITLLLH